MLTIIKAETGGQWVSDKNTDQLFVMGLAQFTTCKKKVKLAKKNIYIFKETRANNEFTFLNKRNIKRSQQNGEEMETFRGRAGKIRRKLKKMLENRVLIRQKNSRKMQTGMKATPETLRREK